MELKREIYPELLENLNQREILILLGARQVGKTFLLEELKEHCLNKNKRTKYYNLELPEHSRLFSKDLVELYKEITKNTDFLFIDEFQYFKNASKLFKAIYDDRKLKVKIIASGSSSLEMHTHLKESLAGRKYTKITRPLTYKEFSQSNKNFEQYLKYGGKPGLVNISSPDKKLKYLKEILETYILKDIKALIKEEKISAFNNLIYYLAYNQGQVISANSLANELRLSNLNVESYLEILEQTYILYKVPSFAGNLSNELKKSRKYYLYDSGIRNAILNNFEEIKIRKDKGAIYEGYVNSFLVNNCPANGEIRFWRTRNGEEIDFVFLKNQKPYIFEVKSRLSSLEIPRTVRMFVKNYPSTKGAYIINENLEGELEYLDRTIRFIKIQNLENDNDLRIIFKNLES